MGAVVDGGDGPGQADAQEHVDRIAARDIADAIIGTLVMLGGNHAGECIWRADGSPVFVKVTFQPAVSDHSPGMLVPRATNRMAVTESLMLRAQPK